MAHLTIRHSEETSIKLLYSTNTGFYRLWSTGDDFHGFPQYEMSKHYSEEEAISKYYTVIEQRYDMLQRSFEAYENA